MKRVLVIGGGAAGMMAAIAAAEAGAQTVLLEKNEKLGKKVYITGKGRCNLTNACELTDFFRNIVNGEKFLYSSLYSFTNEDLQNFFANAGLELKVERGNRVFPASDHSSDVIRTLKDELERRDVEIRLLAEVKEIRTENCAFRSITVSRNGKITELAADACIIATGGLSYPTTGSTGDGYRFAGELGHRIVEPIPALTALICKEPFIRDLEGLSLKNIEVSIMDDAARGKCLYREFGEMLFTADGVSGPVILSASSLVNRRLHNPKKGQGSMHLQIDLKPALDRAQLDKRVLRDFEGEKNREFKNALNHLLPARLIAPVIRISGIPENKKVNEITREERQQLIETLKALPLTITDTEDFKRAVITAGGVSLKEINPSTMESKFVRGIYFAGEVMDVDAFTGGFNLQIAFSTGHLAGTSAAQE